MLRPVKIALRDGAQEGEVHDLIGVARKQGDVDEERTDRGRAVREGRLGVHDRDAVVTSRK